MLAINNSITNPLQDIFEGVKTYFFSSENEEGVNVLERDAKISSAILAAKRTAVAAIAVFVILKTSYVFIPLMACAVISTPVLSITVGGLNLFLCSKFLIAALGSGSLIPLAFGGLCFYLGARALYHYKSLDASILCIRIPRGFLDE